MQQVKNIGGIGSILLLCVMIPYLGLILSFAGFVMLIIAVYKLSELLGQKEIFRNYLIGIILNISMILIIFFGIGTSVLLAIKNGLTGLGIGIILTFLFVWFLTVISGYFIKKSFGKIGQATGVDAFKTAGNLYFIGGILWLIGIGPILWLVAMIIQIIAFFSLPLTLPGKPREARPIS